MPRSTSPGRGSDSVPRQPRPRGGKLAAPCHQGADTSPRLFVGLALSESVRRRISEIPVANVSSLRPVPTDSLHITLHFLGATPLHTVRAVLQSVHAPSFVLSINGVGTFPSLSNPNVVWVGVRPSLELSALKSAVDSALEEAGLAKPDRNSHFTPHVTIARMKTPPRSRRKRRVSGRGNSGQSASKAVTNEQVHNADATSTCASKSQVEPRATELEQLLMEFDSFDAGQFSVNSFVLYESILNTGSIRYEVREIFSLTGET